MKKLYLLSISLFFIFYLNAQDVKEGLKIPSTYDRNSITFVLLNFPSDYHAKDILSKIGLLEYSDKFYNNNISYSVLQMPYSRNDISLNKVGQIKKLLEDKRIANDIIFKWYSITNDGKMSLDLVHERGMFNATDATFLLAKTTKRGNAQLEDYGNRLINKSYILVLDYQSVLTMREAKKADRRGWQAVVSAYLFKLDYNEEVQNKVYDLWIFDDDLPSVKESKKATLSQLLIPINYITGATVNVDASQSIERSTVERILIPDKSEEQLLEQLVQKGYDDILYSLESVVEDFKVKTTITDTKPLKAKIGYKEGLSIDNRFFVYEYILNESKNTTKQKYRGIIRATSKIADNREVASGNMSKSTFYQTAGKKIENGFLIQQRNDFGLEISLGIEYGDFNGLYGRFDYRLGKFIGIRSLFAYVEYVIDGDDSDQSRVGIGLAKGMQLTRNIELRPYFGIGSHQNSNYDYSIKYYKTGLIFSFNLFRNNQLYAGASYYITPDQVNVYGLALNGGIKFGF